PWFAEVWHQRAVAQFKLSNFSEAIRDCHQTLEINPYHFTAAAGMGKAYLRLDNHVSALQSFRRALRLNPNLDGIRAQVVRLAKMVEDNK
ncbi:MAG: tetratricopeptide repeat protein, partial [Thermoguttaceae bacterium]